MFDTRGLGDPFAQTLANLTYYMSSRSQAVTMLTSWSYPWDAGIVLRSFYESCIKVLFLSLSPIDKRDELLKEFWDDFDSIHTIRRARKATFVEELAEGGGSLSSAVFATLSDPNLQDLSPLHNKSKRKEIEQRWSFSELVEALAKLDVPERRLTHMRSLLHFYGLASHLIHADKTALDLMIDRRTRPEPEKSIVQAAQSGRIFSDLVSLWYFCADVMRQAFGLAFKNEKEMLAAIDKVTELGRPFATLFEDSQKDFYERMAKVSRGEADAGSGTTTAPEANADVE